MRRSHSQANAASPLLPTERPSTQMRQKIEKHLRGCRRCSAVYDSMRKTLVITGDERALEVPVGYSERLHAFLDRTISKGSTT